MAIINPDIRITAAARFDTEAAVGNKILKQTLQQQSGADARRLSRLSLIAALGAGLLRGQGEIRPDCAVFLGTPFSSPSVFEKMADNVLNHHAAMPFNFIANLHNAPSFHAAQMLGSSGATVFVPADNRPNRQFYPLLAAALSLHAGGQAAVGWCYEHHAGYPCTREGSVWLLLEHGATTGAAVRVKRRDAADPQEKRRADAYYWQDVCGWLNGQPEKERVLAAGGWDVLVGAADFPMAQDKIG